MNWNQLDYFTKAYRERSFTAAARQVPMSAQGLTKAVRSLEGELGVTLFTPTEGGGQAPTPHADEFMAFCEECLGAYDRLQVRFAKIDGVSRVTVNFAAAIGSFSILGMEFLSRFRHNNPGIDVACDDLPDVRVEKSLRNGTNTLGITVLPVSDEFETVELAACERYAWVSVDDPLAHKRTLDIRDLEGRVVATVGPQFKGYGLLQDSLREAGVTPEDVVTSSEMMWLHEFARNGSGIAFTAQSVLPLYADDPRVATLAVPNMAYRLGISWLRGHELTEPEHLLVDACVERAAAIAGEQGHARTPLMQRLRELLGRSGTPTAEKSSGRRGV